MPKQIPRQDTHANNNQPEAYLVTLSETAEATVARLAYQLWLQRGSPDGSPDEDWYRAESLLESGITAASSPAFLPTN